MNVTTTGVVTASPSTATTSRTRSVTATRTPRTACSSSSSGQSRHRRHRELTDTVTEIVPGAAHRQPVDDADVVPDAGQLGPINPMPAPVDHRHERADPAGGRRDQPGRGADVNLQPSFCPGRRPHVRPANDGIDFYESLEGMLVTVENPVAVSATRTFSPFSSELFTLHQRRGEHRPSDARTAGAASTCSRSPNNTGDQNPERVQIQFDPTISGGAGAGDHGRRSARSVTGVVGYSFGNFEVNRHRPGDVRAGRARDRDHVAGPVQEGGDRRQLQRAQPGGARATTPSGRRWPDTSSTTWARPT